MPAFGLASSGAVLVGEAIGGRRFALATAFVRLSLLVSAAWMLAVGFIYMAFPTALLAWFRPTDVGPNEFVHVGANMLFLASFWQLFDAFAITLSECLRAAGDTAWCMWARIILAWFVFVPGAWVAVVEFEGGVPAVMISMTGYILLLAVALGFRFLSGRWKSIDLIGSEPAPQPTHEALGSNRHDATSATK